LAASLGGGVGVRSAFRASGGELRSDAVREVRAIEGMNVRMAEVVKAVGVGGKNP